MPHLNCSYNMYCFSKSIQMLFIAHKLPTIFFFVSRYCFCELYAISIVVSIANNIEGSLKYVSNSIYFLLTMSHILLCLEMAI